MLDKQRWCYHATIIRNKIDSAFVLEGLSGRAGSIVGLGNWRNNHAPLYIANIDSRGRHAGPPPVTRVSYPVGERCWCQALLSVSMVSNGRVMPSNQEHNGIEQAQGLTM